MRHGKSFNHLGRKSEHRKAMLANMASSLILHKKIETTTAKAKALRRYVEPLLTKSKEDSTNSRRVVFSYLKDKTAVTELFREVSVKISDRPGGYTRILKTGIRLGDNADMCIIELVDYNENMLTTGDDKKGKSKRRRGTKKKASDKVAPASVNETTDSKVSEKTLTKEAGQASEKTGAATEISEVAADTIETSEEEPQVEESIADEPENKENKPEVNNEEVSEKTKEDEKE